MKTGNGLCYRSKNMLMPANKILLKYQKLKCDCSVFLHLCSFTYSHFSYSPFIQENSSFFLLCLLSALLWEGTQSVRLSRRILDSSFMYFFKSCSSPRSFYLWKTGHGNPASGWFSQRVLAYALACAYWKQKAPIHTQSNILNFPWRGSHKGPGISSPPGLIG